ncbi:hypothetical protein AB5J49_27995 [Streptomyces sp. R28]|uniref:Uncharacterized protein n=1 Tax=Streptomyces sp. R28 TaxID=3238628 RepID=A0AB39QHJ3_9ACTN
MPPPGLQAAAFEALSKLPRIRLDHDDVDVAGRSAVGVSCPEVDWTFLFDRRTYDYLWVRSGWYWETRTLQDLRAVDRIGQYA